MCPEDQEIEDTCHLGGTGVVRTSVVSQATQTLCEGLHAVPSQGGEPNTSTSTPTRDNAKQGSPQSSSLLKTAMGRKNLPPKVLEHIMGSWREKTKIQYSIYHRKWRTYCILKQVDPLSPNLNTCLSFLVYLFDKGLGYSGLNSARSALSCVLPQFEGHNFGSHPLTVRLLRSFYNKRPPQARYATMWDPDVVIDYLREKVPLKDLSIKELTLKVCMLFLLATCSRQQRLISLKRSNIKFQLDGSVDIRIDTLQKHSSRGKSLEVLSLKPFNADKSICVVTNLKAYLKKTEEVTNAGDLLFCSFAPPYKAVGTQTIARWTKFTMKKAGIDTDLFKAHSTRGSSASKMAKMGIPLTDILKKGHWSHESTFKHFYLRHVK